MKIAKDVKKAVELEVDGGEDSEGGEGKGDNGESGRGEDEVEGVGEKGNEKAEPKSEKQDGNEEWIDVRSSLFLPARPDVLDDSRYLQSSVQYAPATTIARLTNPRKN